MLHIQMSLIAVLVAALALADGNPIGGYGGVVVDSGLGKAESYSSISSVVAPVVAAPVVKSYAVPAVQSYAVPAVQSYAAPAVAYSKVVEPEIIAYPAYAFKYGVQDGKTGDVKDQAEERDGDVVKGEYSLLQPDGRKRTVSYVSDKKNGFNAVVSYSGQAVHPEVVQLAPAKVASYGSVY